MKKLSLFLTLFLGFSCNNAMGCIRTDLSDRSKEEVLEKSYFLATQGDYSQVTGMITYTILDDELNSSIVTAVALDPWTVLSCAHGSKLKNAKEIEFILASDISNCKEENKYKVSNLFIYNEFKINKAKKAMLKKSGSNGEYYILLGSYHIPLKLLPQLKYTDHEEIFNFISETNGVDLAVFKLDRSLPDDLIFPQILPETYKIQDTYGISLGYGDILYNQQEECSISAYKDPNETNKRHLISCKVSTFSKKDGTQILYGKYSTKFINGNKSFIPEKNMLKTEGIPVLGNSGGPFFVMHDNIYKLVGILSKVASINPEPITNKGHRQSFKDFTQNIYPTWIDVRPYWPWISGHMGEKKEVIISSVEENLKTFHETFCS